VRLNCWLYVIHDTGILLFDWFVAPTLLVARFASVAVFLLIISKIAAVPFCVSKRPFSSANEILLTRLLNSESTV